MKQVAVALILLAGCAEEVGRTNGEARSKGDASRGGAGTELGAAADAAARTDSGAPGRDARKDGARLDVAGGADRAGPAPLTECTSPKPEWVFCSGFEEGNFSIWDDYDGNPPTTNDLVADPGPWGVAGNHVGHLFVPAGRGGADLVKLVPPHDRLYARWYVKYQAGFDFTANNHGSGLWAGSRDVLGRSGIRPDGTDMFQMTVQYEPGSSPIWGTYNYYPAMYQDCADPNGSCWGDSLPCVYDQGQTYCTKAADRPSTSNAPPPVVADRWYCVEFLLDGGTPTSSASGASGVFDWWLDGKEMGPFTLWLRSTAALQISGIWLSLFFHGTHGVPGVYYDNVVVSTQRVGCL